MSTETLPKSDGPEVVHLNRLDAEPPMAWHAFVAALGVSSVTAWRWRKAGHISVVMLAGKPYVTRAEIYRFNQRLIAGELAGTRTAGPIKGRATA